MTWHDVRTESKVKDGLVTKYGRTIRAGAKVPPWQSLHTSDDENQFKSSRCQYRRLPINASAVAAISATATYSNSAHGVPFDHVGYQPRWILKVVHCNNADTPTWRFRKILVEARIYSFRITTGMQVYGAGKSNV